MERNLKGALVMAVAVLCIVSFVACANTNTSGTAAPESPDSSSITSSANSISISMEQMSSDFLFPAPLSQDQVGGQFSGTPPKAKKHYTIGVSWYWMSGEFMTECHYYMDRFVTQNYAGDVTLVEMDGKGDPAVQLSQVGELISQKVDMVLLDPFSRVQMTPATLACKAAGIPCIEFNAETNATYDRVSYVGSDNYVSGAQVTKAMATALGGKGNIAVLLGPTGDDVQAARSSGMNDVLKNYPEINIVAQYTDNWDRASGMASIENLLAAGQELQGIIGQDDEMAMGALQAIGETPNIGKIEVVGIGGITDALKAIKDGSMLCTSYQSARGQAETSIAEAVQYLNGGTILSLYNIPFVVVDKNNVADPQFDNTEALLVK